MKQYEREETKEQTIQTVLSGKNLSDIPNTVSAGERTRQEGGGGSESERSLRHCW